MAPRPPPLAKRFTLMSATRPPEQNPYLAARLIFIPLPPSGCNKPLRAKLPEAPSVGCKRLEGVGDVIPAELGEEGAGQHEREGGLDDHAARGNSRNIRALVGGPSRLPGGEVHRGQRLAQGGGRLHENPGDRPPALGEPPPHAPPP